MENYTTKRYIIISLNEKNYIAHASFLAINKYRRVDATKFCEQIRVANESNRIELKLNRVELNRTQAKIKLS
jgi:hypothetical protein